MAGAPGASIGGAAGGSASGSGGTGAAAGGAGGFGGGGFGGSGAVADPLAAGPRPLRRLTQREYLNTVRDLLETPVALGPLPADTKSRNSGFAFHTTEGIGLADALLYRNAAEVLARAFVIRLGRWLPCAASAPVAGTEADCLKEFLGPSGFAGRLFRRPLSTTPVTGEVARFTALYSRARAAPLLLNFADSIGLLVEAGLVSPEFLYHWEMGPGPVVREGAVVKLGDYELANRLSYLLWGTMPDASLLEYASLGRLTDPASPALLEGQIRRMLKDPRAAGTFTEFFTEWLDIDALPDTPKDATTYPTYDVALTTAMTEEVRRFVNTVIFEGTGRFDHLLTATASFADPALASLYGIAGVSGTALVPVTLNPTQRSGLLTTGAFMTVTGAVAGSSPARRGAIIADRLLCATLPATLPANHPTALPAGAGTTRQRSESQGAMACAQACHGVIDPLGFAFENYDGIGAYRTTEGGAAVNARSTVQLDGQAKTFDNAISLIAALATSEQAQACFTRQWFRYGLRRRDTPQDLASLNASVAAFTNSVRDIRELVVALTRSRTFLYRTPGTGEVLP